MIVLAGKAAASGPWWETPLIAGVAAIIGAAIAFGSTYFSDRRRLNREDLRQWDKEIRDIYVAVAALTKQMMEFRWFPTLPADPNDMTDEQRSRARARYEEASSYTVELEAQADQLRRFASERTVESMDKLVDSARNITATFHDLFHPGKHPFVGLSGRRGELLHAVQENLRLRAYRPYIRPPMSRWTKTKLWTRIRANPHTTGKLKWWQGRRFYWGSGTLAVVLVGLLVWWAI